MIEIPALWLTLLINVCAGSVLLLIAWLLRVWWQNRRDYRAMRRLARRMREGAAQRRTELRQYIGDCCRLPEEQTEVHVAQLDQAERQLTSSFIGAYVRRDAQAAEGFDNWVGELAAQYRLLAPAAAAHSDGNAAELAAEQQALRDQVDVLQTQLSELKHKLAVSYETIDRMLKEYSQMFSGGDSSEGVDREVLMQLVAGKEDGHEQAAGEGAADQTAPGSDGDGDGDGGDELGADLAADLAADLSDGLGGEPLAGDAEAAQGGRRDAG